MVNSSRKIIEEIYSRYHHERLLVNDPLCWVRSFKEQDAKTLEIAALIASAFAYGRVELIQKCLADIKNRCGHDLRAFCQATSLAQKKRTFKNFKYRFNNGTELALLLESAGRAINHYGSLETMAVQGAGNGIEIKAIMVAMVAGLKRFLPPMKETTKTFGYLFADPSSGSACKRLNMFMRWVVRPDDGIDLGIWQKIKPSTLRIPVDVHVARIAKVLKLTGRTTADWRMSEEITTQLRELSPEDPVKYDFSLCQAGMADFRRRTL